MKPKQILLIDDEPSLQLTVGDQLRMEGYEVIGATSGDKALQILHHTAPDLIILDISMPGMSGLALLNKLSNPNEKSRFPILIFTARANMEPFFSTLNIEGFLSKTSDPSLLLSEVKRILVKTQKQITEKPPHIPDKKKLIIILDDDPILSKRLETFFMASGYNANAILDSHLLLLKIMEQRPAIILIKAILNGITGNTIAASLADFPHARGIPVILFDGSGIYHQGDNFLNVDRIVPSNAPADLMQTVTAIIG